MQTIYSTDCPRRRLILSRPQVLSAVVHTAVLAGLFSVLHHISNVAPYKLPGTAIGVRMLTYYSPGSAHPTSGALASKAPEAPPTRPAEAHIAAKAPAQAATAEKGTGSDAESGYGQGDITIALAKVFPPPKPDLSSLPHGTRGDVILDAVIDEQGAIGKITLVQGLGPAIDDAVIATVRGWTYTPAMRNGQPVPSEQEFLFHYERG